MKNTLKFSLLSTVLCTMSIVFSNCYSGMKEYDSDNDDDNYSILSNNNIINDNDKKGVTDTGKINNEEKELLEKIDKTFNSKLFDNSYNSSDINLLSEFLSKQDKNKMEEIIKKDKYALNKYKSICNFILIKKLNETQNKLNKVKSKLEKVMNALNNI